MTFEVDAYIDPTHLFTCINRRDVTSAVSRALEFPDEVKTWVVSRTTLNTRSLGSDEVENVVEIKWKYLPLHLACLQPNPSNKLIVALIQVYPQGAKIRDYHGHLPFHYLLSEGCENLDTVKAVFNANRKALLKSNGRGSSPQKIIQNIVSQRSREILEKWLVQELGNIVRSREEEGKRLKGMDLDHIRTSNTFSSDTSTHLFDDRFDENGVRQVLVNDENRVNCKASFLASKYRVSDESIRHFENISNEQSKVNLHSCVFCQKITKEVDSLKKDVKLDAEIILSQDNRIKELESDLISCEKEAHLQREETSMLKNIIEATEEKSIHIREVTNMFQSIIANKDQDLKLLHEQLQILSDRQHIESRSELSRAGEILNRLTDELSPLMTRVSMCLNQSPQICDDCNCKLNQKQSPNSRETKICSLDKVNNLRSQMCKIERCICSMSEDLRLSREENLSLLKEKRSRRSNAEDVENERVKEESISTTTSPAEIKERQLYLQNELKKIYEQIKGVIPIEADSTSIRPNLDIGLKSNAEVGNELLEDFRPWRRQAKE